MCRRQHKCLSTEIGNYSKFFRIDKLFSNKFYNNKQFKHILVGQSRYVTFRINPNFIGSKKINVLWFSDTMIKIFSQIYTTFF